ncbi:proton-conducting transporter transmembrane domain-containing protein [Thermococcus pacificus]|uniref:Cation:proton antiporter n=1 Tax=Thermococcus pacificus TaxID=71998 RepID=A0A218P8E8_9EURY|nr:proton-conducting transporter membrane subunit [Thermococcus pacificus]ASJ07010.1 cation:proton antiporter [Thermococcus pacificus]
MNLLILPVIPMAFAFVLPLLSTVIRNRRFIFGYALFVTGITLLMGGELFRQVYSSELPLTYSFGGWKAPVGIIYEVDRFGAVMVLVTAALMFLTAVYSVRYLEREDGVEWFYTLYLGLEAGLLGIFMTGDAFNLFVMLEVTAISSYGLVMFYTEEGYPAYSGLRYAIISSIGTTLYFLALVLIYRGLGTVNFADISAKLHGIEFPISTPLNSIVPILAISMALITWAFTIKAAIMPNHFWLPGAHSAAPSPVSAVLSGLVVNAGSYGFMRFLSLIYVPEVSRIGDIICTLLLILGAISALLSSIAMTVQDDVKRIVAYSTILNMGYLAMAVGVNSEAGTAGAVFHMVNHAIAKALLFLAVGVFIHAAGSRKLDELKGLGKNMPFTTVSLAIATMSLVGLPPTNVFFSKLLLYRAYIEKSPVLVAVLLLSSLFALVSYMRVLYWLWVKKPDEKREAHEPRSMVAVLVILAIACLVIGVLSPILVDRVVNPAVAQLKDVEGYIRAALTTGVK